MPISLLKSFKILKNQGGGGIEKQGGARPSLRGEGACRTVDTKFSYLVRKKDVISYS